MTESDKQGVATLSCITLAAFMGGVFIETGSSFAFGVMLWCALFSAKIGAS